MENEINLKDAIPKIKRVLKSIPDEEAEKLRNSPELN